MKYTLFATLIYLSIATSAQHKEVKHGHFYSSIQAVGYSTEHAFIGGPHLSLGYSENNFAFGPGAGMIILPRGGDPYIPLYFQFMYVGGKKKFSPMANFHVGRGFYKGSVSFLGEDAEVKAQFYAHAATGLAIRFKKSRVHLLGGITLMAFQSYDTYDASTFNESLFTFGLGFFTSN